jgi:FMN phosphatase YigB (HAD superfamily)
MIIIDFDDTLYNTHLLVEQICVVLDTYGISRDEARATMKTAIVVGDVLHYDYSYERHIAVLEQAGHQFDATHLLADLMRITVEHDFTDAQAVECLTRFKALGQHIILLTAGNETFQRMKLNSTALTPFFDDVVVVHGDKDTVVADLPREEHMFFINDKSPENEIVAKRFPYVTVITKHNPQKAIGDRVPTMSLPTFDSLLEIADYVEHTSK